MKQLACYHELVTDGISTFDGVATSDLLLIASYVHKAKKVLEIGTCHGRTTINIAKFCAEDGKVYTIDKDQSKSKSHMDKYQDLKNKILFIEEDTSKIDWKSIEQFKNFDVIFIDGCHDYDVVLTDTIAALDMIKDDGVILWHDFVDGNLHDKDDKLLGLPCTVALVLKKLDLPVIPIGGYLAMLEMSKLKKVT